MLRFDHVTKFYGPVIGVNDVTCCFEPGITGLLGANGAGKSTLLNLAAGQLRPSQGAVRVCGLHAWSSRAKQRVGYSPDINSLYEEMSGREFVYTLACLHGYSRREARQRTDEVLDRVGMLRRADRRLRGYSHGMRQRIKLAQALVHDPQVLLLDEPLSGIDPGGRRDVNQLLVELAAEGKTILFSSHILEEVEQVADRIVVMARGRLIARGTLDEVRRSLADRPLLVEVAAASPRQLAGTIVGWPDVEGIELGDDRLRVRTRQPAQFFAQLQRVAADGTAEITHLDVLDAGAEAVFRYLYQEA